jgi:hypothetical protein
MPRSIVAGAIAVLGAGPAIAQPSPATFILVETSVERCDAATGDPMRDRYKIYATNSNAQRRISANLRYQTTPPGRGFALRDNQLGDYTEQFPKFYEHRLAPRERRLVGCTHIFRTGRNVHQYDAVAFTVDVAGAVFVSPNDPVPPAEDPKTFTGFMVERWEANNGTCLSSNPGVYYMTNLHPTNRITADVDVRDNAGSHVGVLTVHLAPFGNVRLTCSQADPYNFSVSRVRSAQFTTTRSSRVVDSPLTTQLPKARGITSPNFK